MRRLHPAAADRDRPVVDAIDAELLEALDRSYDVYQRVHRTDLVERHLLGRHAVDPALGFTQQPERPHRALPHPRRHRCPLENVEQLAHVAMRSVVMVVGMRMGMRLVDGFAGRFVTAIGKRDVDFRRPDPAAVHLLDGHMDGESESLGKSEKPLGRRSSGDEGAEHHVAADAGGGIQNGKPSI